MDKVFIDTDIALDLLARREPYYAASADLFTMADRGMVDLYISALSLSNLHYLLSRQHNTAESSRILANFKVLVKALAVDDKIIELALSSRFPEFEDAIQYYTAVENGIQTLLTRNAKDYKLASIRVLTAELYVKQQGKTK
ncbi:MAG: PIN domain-containing protein [Chitinophagaceae bacterium]|nr:MAG: PIN domain-containing protein [Chitinophagaceae bacterium]